MLWALLPLVLLRLYWRGFREPGYRLLLGERFGFYGGEKSRAAGKLVIWVHAVSLGEMNASKPIIDRLIGLLPDARLLITNMTAAGRHEAKKTYGDRAVIVWLPYDYPFAVRRFLSRFKPDLAILMETELWANLIAARRDAKIRMLLANARLSERSARRYHCVFPLISEVISAIDVVAAQSDADRTRFAGLGAKAICVAGNVKFDVPEALGSDEKARAFRKQFGARRVMLWASTREGEEAELLDAFSRRPLTNVLTVIVPRHPQRFSDVARLLDQREIGRAHV